MVIHVYPTRLHTEQSPRWRARAEDRGVRLWTRVYASKTDAAIKAIAMVDAALSYGETGDFVGLADGSFRRMRVGEMVIDDEA